MQPLSIDPASPATLSMMAFWACRRFSAWGEDDGGVGFDHRVAGFQPPPGGQAVHEDGIGLGMGHQLRGDREALEAFLALLELVFAAHGGPDIGCFNIISKY